MDDFYIQEDGQELGPFSFDELTDRGVAPDTLVRINTAAWEKAADLPDFFEYFRYYGYYFPTENNLAGFGIRLLAYLIDYVIMVIVLVVALMFYISYAAPNVAPDVYLLAHQDVLQGVIVPGSMVLYFALTGVSPLSSSLGQALCKLVIVNEEGRKMSVGQALGRSFCKFLSGFFVGIGFLGILFSQYKQAFHDVVVKTYVIRKDVY